MLSAVSTGPSIGLSHRLYVAETADDDDHPRIETYDAEAASRSWAETLSLSVRGGEQPRLEKSKGLLSERAESASAQEA